MSDTKKVIIVVSVIALILFAFKISNKDGSSYIECMEKRRNEIQNVAQKSIAALYCRSKFPHETSRPSESSTPKSFSFEDAFKTADKN